MINKINNLTKTEDAKRLLSNFFSLFLLQFFSYVLPLLTLPYLVKVLGVEKFGLVMFSQSFIVFFNIFVDYGFNLSATREVSIHRDNIEKLTEIFSSVIMIKLIFTFLSFIVLFLLILLFERFYKDIELYLLTFLFVVGQAIFPVWYFQGLEKMKYITIVNVSSKIFFTIAIFIFIKEESDYILVPIFNGGGFIISGMYSLWILKRHFNQKFELQKLRVLMPYLKDSTQFFLSRFSVTLYTSANAFVLGVFTNTTMVGYYSIAEKLYQALQGMYNPIAQVLYPYVAKVNNISLFKKVFVSVVLINVLGLAFLFFFDEYIFSLLFTNEVGNESLRVFHVFLVVTFFVVPSVLLGYPFLGALGFANYANKSVIYGSILHILGLCALCLLGIVSIYSIAFMVLFTEILVLILRIFWIRKNILL